MIKKRKDWNRQRLTRDQQRKAQEIRELMKHRNQQPPEPSERQDPPPSISQQDDLA